MGQLTSITLSEIGKNADQTLVLVPRGINPANGVATLAEANAVPALERRATVSVSQPSRNRKTYKVQLRFSNPETCTASGQCDPSVNRTAYSTVEFTFTSYSTASERALLRTEVAAMLANPLIVDAIDNLNPAY